jgi:hypothetical protein
MHAVLVVKKELQQELQSSTRDPQMLKTYSIRGRPGREPAAWVAVSPTSRLSRRPVAAVRPAPARGVRPAPVEDAAARAAPA